MGDEEKWHHAGISEVQESETQSGRSVYRIRIPSRLFEQEEIVKVGKRIYWSYEDTVGTNVISDSELEDDDYEAVNHSDFSDSDNYRATIPKKFFEDYEGRGNPAIADSVPEDARFEAGERRHFIYHQDMADGDVKSCWVLTDEEFSLRFENSDRWDGNLDQVPRFI